jgi:signal transduction histidine kinase
VVEVLEDLAGVVLVVGEVVVVGKREYWYNILMTPELHLILHNAGFIASSVAGIGMALYCFLNNPNRVANITLALTMLAITTFCISHLFGVNTHDPIESRNILMFNVSIIYTALFNLHCVLALLGKDKERKNILIFIYTVSIALTAFYIINPDNFLYLSIPKMYFPNYYVPGEFHWVMRLIFNIVIPIYFFTELVLSYRKASDVIERNRIWYFFFAAIVGYILGSIPILLVFNINIDPAWGSLFIFFLAIPYVYATVRYELMDIRIVAKKAFFYAISIASVGGLIIFFNYFGEWLKINYTDIPFWISPLISSVLIVLITVIVWRQLRQGDVLKSEFIHIVMHKFRTPLTRIKWASDELSKEKLSESAYSELEHIKLANTKLVELTNLLVNVDEADGVHTYRIENKNLSIITEELINSLSHQFKDKNIKLIHDMDNDVMAKFDEERIKFVMQVFIENAINYSNKDSEIKVELKKETNKVLFSVSDKGMGISKEEINFIFTKFYRGNGAQSRDTEGMGIGLFISKKIIENHSGDIGVDSDGVGKGSKFYFSLPI